MDKLSSIQITKEIVQKHDFRFSKSLGQNFLIDSNIIDKIIDGANIGEDDYVLEVGPGIGTLTREISKRAKKVVAVEIDKKLIPILRETLSDLDNVEVINSDILKLNILEVIKEKMDNKPIKLVANLPYYITTPIVMKFLEENIPVETIVVMVQKEVADRMQANPGTKDYGALSVAVQYYSNPHVVTKVPRTLFIPQPNVESSVICLDVHKKPIYELRDKDLFFDVVKSSFGKRRKTLLNALSSGSIVVSKEEIKKVLEQSGIEENRRGETLTIDEFAKLSNVLYDNLNK